MPLSKWVASPEKLLEVFLRSLRAHPPGIFGDPIGRGGNEIRKMQMVFGGSGPCNRIVFSRGGGNLGCGEREIGDFSGF